MFDVNPSSCPAHPESSAMMTARFTSERHAIETTAAQVMKDHQSSLTSNTNQVMTAGGVMLRTLKQTSSSQSIPDTTLGVNRHLYPPAALTCTLIPFISAKQDYFKHPV